MDSGLKKVALTLHGLSVKDRAWMLDRISESCKPKLGELTAELNSLTDGFAGSLESQEFSRVLMKYENDANPAIKTNVEKKDNVYLQVERYPIKVILDWADEEAEWIVAHVLTMNDWKWTEGLLENLHQDKRMRIENKIKTQATMPKAMADQLLLSLASNLEMRSKKIIVNRQAVISMEKPVKGRIAKWFRSFAARS